MKSRKILLPALFSIALAFSLILLTSVLNMAPVMAREQVTPMVAAGPESEPTKGNLGGSSLPVKESVPTQYLSDT
jgi:hypothetical protein